MDERYQVMPPLTAEEYAALKEDIKENGVMVPVELDENGEILDGYNRVQICKELGITDYPTVVRTGLTEEEKYEHALRLNVRRRHLSSQQLSDVIQGYKAKHPGISDRQVARAVGVSHATVLASNERVSGGQPDHLKNVKGSDGKRYPASKEQAEQQRQKIREAIQQHPEMTVHQIATSMGVSDSTVSAQKKKIADAADAKAKQEADKSRYDAFLKPSAENLLHDLQGEADSEDEYLHFLLEDFGEDADKTEMLHSEEGIAAALKGLAEIKHVVEKYEALMCSHKEPDRDPH